MENLMDKIVALCKRRGYVFPGSELYDGLSGTWDLGPLGVLLSNNIKNEWRKSIILSKDNVVEVDSSILLNPKVWEVSGHISSFTDPLVECRHCHQRYRVDYLINTEAYPIVMKEFKVASEKALKDVEISQKKIDILLMAYRNILAGRDWARLNEEEKVTLKNLLEIAKKEIDEDKKKLNFHKLIVSELHSFKKFYGFFTWVILNRTTQCPNCGEIDWVIPKEFNLMFKTYIGPIDNQESQTYLRPETAQGIFINYKNVVESTRVKIPFGIAQIGKGFRNEITIGNFLFRAREFEMMELEYFVKPDQAEIAHKELINERLSWYQALGIKRENLKLEILKKEDLAHYSRATTEIWYNWPFMGFGELEGVANRGDHDLLNHSKYSGKNFQIADETSINTSEGSETPQPPYLPYVIEPSVGVGRAMLAFLLDSYFENEERVILRLHPKLAPYKAAVFPLLANKPKLVEKARRIYDSLRPHFMTAWDARGNIGKRYFAQDEVGTPFCITVDFQTLEDGTATIRERDSAKQKRMRIDKLKDYILAKLAK